MSPSLPPALRSSSFRNLVYGQTVSSLGDWMATVALMALVLEVTGSPTAVGGVLALRLMPSLFAGPIATSVAVRFDRRRTMLAMDLIRAGLVVLIPLVDQLWWIYTFAFLTELGNLIFLPSRDASIPDLVDEKDLPTANGIVLLSSYANIPIGAGAFAALQASASAAGGPFGRNPFIVVFVVDALTYLVSYAFIRRIRLSGTAELKDEGEGDLAAFLRAFRLPLLRSVLPGLAAITAGIGALFSLGIVYVREVLGASNAQFGVLIVIFGVGATAAVIWLQVREGGTTIGIVRSSVLAMGAMLAVMSLVSNLAWSLFVAVFFGAAASAAIVGALAFLQEQLRGVDRVLGLTAFHIVFRLGMSVAALGAGYLSERLPDVTWPVVGLVRSSALIMFGSGFVVMFGALVVRPGLVEGAAEEPA